MIIRLIDPLGNVGGLLVKRHQHSTTIGIEATGPGTAVADLLDHASHQGDEIHLSFGCHLTGDHAQTGVHHRFAGHAAGWILGQECVQHRITDLVTDLVGMPLGDRLGGEDVLAHS